jgi:two-component system phosphate regulon response regulator OmpR
VTDYLRLHGLDARGADGGPAMRRAMAERPADLVVLDVRMPGEDGLTLARELRAGHDVGIVMATAVGDIVDRVVGLELGADDYVAKPLDLRELLARIRAVLRRRSGCAARAGGGRRDPLRRLSLRRGGRRAALSGRQGDPPDPVGV